MLIALAKVPHLAIVCSEQHVLKELVATCSEAKRCCAGLITGVAIDCPNFSVVLHTDIAGGVCRDALDRKENLLRRK